MIPYVYAPLTPGEWIKRLFSLVNLVWVVLVIALIASEFRFDWCERLAGQYLVSINHSRPETGSIWESGRHTRNAHHSLNTIIDQKEAALREVMEASSFLALAEELGPGEWVNLDKVQFKALYNTLSRELQETLVDQVRLLWLLYTDAVDRIFCEGQPDELKLYFIDSGNRVIHQMDLNMETLRVQSSRTGFSTGLNEMEAFSGRIYAADVFFKGLFKLPEEMVEELIGSTRELIRQEGTLKRVGISSNSENGYILLGFEFTTVNRIRVVQIQAREWAVWQLNIILRGEAQ